MTIAAIQPIPPLRTLPTTLPLDNAVRIELEEGVPVFRATSTVQERIEFLLEKQSDTKLTKREQQELDLYEEINDYLSFVNRTVRNLLLPHPTQKV
jgi:hypothetical protein